MIAIRNAALMHLNGIGNSRILCDFTCLQWLHSRIKDGLFQQLCCCYDSKDACANSEPCRMLSFFIS